jgi:hypothetical protein
VIYSIDNLFWAIIMIAMAFGPVGWCGWGHNRCKLVLSNGKAGFAKELV